MQILLDGTPIPGYDHRVSVTGQIERGDLSGESSTTGASHKGYKPGVVNVRCKVNMDRPADVLTFRALFQQLDPETGAPAVWDITEPTATAFNIRRVQFTDFLKIEPQDGPRVWDVSFALIEVRSVPQMKEERLADGAAQESTTPEGSQAADESAEWTPETYWEKLLAQADAAIGKQIKYWFGSSDEGS